MILNIFNYSYENKALFNKLIKHLAKHPLNNSLLLIENGVYFGLYLLENPLLNKNIKIYLLETDLIARDLLLNFSSNKQFTIIGYPEFVDLILECEQNITW